MKKVSAFLLSSLLTAGVAGEARAGSCTALLNDLIAHTKAPCTAGNCTNVVSYHMTIMNNDKFVGYSDGWLDYNKDGGYLDTNLNTNSAKFLFNDRFFSPCCPSCTGTTIICMDKQPFSYKQPEQFSFKIKKSGTLALDFTSWNEHYTINLSCQDGYIYGFQPGKLMINLYPKKDYRVNPPSPPK